MVLTQVESMMKSIDHPREKIFFRAGFWNFRPHKKSYSRPSSFLLLLVLIRLIASVIVFTVLCNFHICQADCGDEKHNKYFSTDVI